MFHDGDVNTLNNIMGFAKIVTNFWKLQGENKFFLNLYATVLLEKTIYIKNFPKIIFIHNLFLGKNNYQLGFVLYMNVLWELGRHKGVGAVLPCSGLLVLYKR